MFSKRPGDEGATGRAVRAGDEAAHEEPIAGIRTALLGGAYDARNVLSSSEGTPPTSPLIHLLARYLIRCLF